VERLTPKQIEVAARVFFQVNTSLLKEPAEIELVERMIEAHIRNDRDNLIARINAVIEAK